MSAINNQGVRAWRHWLFVMVFVACCLCVGTGEVSAQGVRISDADVSLTDIAVISHAVKEESVKMQGRLMPGVRPRAGRHPLVKLTSYKRTADQTMLEEAVYKEAARYSIDPDLVFALVWQESGGRLNAVSPKNARGPLQLMPGTAARFGVRNPHDAKEGDGKVINRRGIRTGGIPPYDETENYVRQIAERYRMMRAARAGR